MSSDIAIAQFQFLERLLLVHGHWCYRRISTMVMSSFILEFKYFDFSPCNLCQWSHQLTLFPSGRYATSSIRISPLGSPSSFTRHMHLSLRNLHTTIGFCLYTTSSSRHFLSLPWVFLTRMYQLGFASRYGVFFMTFISCNISWLHRAQKSLRCCVQRTLGYYN